MSSVLRTVREVGGADKYYKVTSTGSKLFGGVFPVIRNGVWIKNYCKYYSNRITIDYYIVRDMGAETRVTSLDPLFIEDYIKYQIENSANLHFVDARVVTPGWARKVQLIVTPDITNSQASNFTDGNDVDLTSDGIGSTGNTAIDTFDTGQLVGPSPTFVGGTSTDIPSIIEPGYLQTKYHIFYVMTRPLVLEIIYSDMNIIDPLTGDASIQRKQVMIKNSMMLTN